MTQRSEPDTFYLLRRAEEESILAIRSDQTAAGAAHYAMALLYSAKARTALIAAEAQPRAGFA